MKRVHWCQYGVGYPLSRRCHSRARVEQQRRGSVRSLCQKHGDIAEALGWKVWPLIQKAAA